VADASIASGSATVDEDLAFHQAVAEAAGNPQFPRLLKHLEQYLRDAMAVTRRNESLKAEFITEVRREHQAIVDAILARDPEAARSAAARHMHQAARRLQDGDAPIRSTAARPTRQGQTP
jgi:GntR family transcriptional repressor for pyruvate dehydrogenase complex